MKKYQDNNAQIDSALDALRGIELSPPASVWREVEASLNAKRKTRIIWLVGSVVVTGLLLGFGYWLMPFGVQNNIVTNSINPNGVITTGTSATPQRPSTESVDDQIAADNPVENNSLAIENQAPGVKNNKDNFAAASDFERVSNTNLPFTEKPHSTSPKSESTINPGSGNIQSASNTEMPEVLKQKALSPLSAGSELQILNSLVIAPAFSNQFEFQELALTSSPIRPKKKITESRFAVGLAAGTFNQNLRVANVETDSIAFYARPGAQFQASISYAVNDKLSIEGGIGYSYNTWESPARLIVAPTTDILPASTDTVVFISTPYQYNQVTNVEQAQGLSKNYNPDQQVALEHSMRYMSYRLGIAYKMVDYRKLCFHVLLQADYLRVLSYSSRFETPSYSMDYPVQGFREHSWGIRPGIGLSYRLIPGLQLFTEAATIIRTSHLLSQPNWKLYENPYGLVAGIRIGW